MFDCAKDVLAHHNEKVTLPQSERTAMRDRRNANRDRLRKGLKDKGKPAPREFKSQGSYAMKTMVQYPDKNYDIDDGVYFDKEVLVGERGAEMTALQARQMVRDAVDDGGFKTPPEVHKNCVRVHLRGRIPRRYARLPARDDEGRLRQRDLPSRAGKQRLEALGCARRDRLVRKRKQRAESRTRTTAGNCGG